MLLNALILFKSMFALQNVRVYCVGENPTYSHSSKFLRENRFFCSNLSILFP